MSYFDDLKAAVDQLPGELLDALYDVIRYATERQIFVIGNGGSAATASHFVCDLAKNAPQGFRARSFDNQALLTAYANDNGYEHTYAYQLMTYAKTGDILIAISTSGNSPNVIYAARWFKNHGFVAALTGQDGGELGRVAHLTIPVQSDCIEIVEDVHLAVCHSLVRRLKDG